MKRFYVTMTWDGFPEGGSYGTIIEASSHEAAEAECRIEMARLRAEEDGVSTEEEVLQKLGSDWHTVDCFDLDDFITRHSRSGSTPPVMVMA